MDHFEGKVAIVTGAVSGIGKEISRALVRRGATVALADVHADNLAATADELGRELAGAVLRGVERNKGIIVFTAFARVGWYFYRLSPTLVQGLQALTSRRSPLLPAADDA